MLIWARLATLSLHNLGHDLIQKTWTICCRFGLVACDCHADSVLLSGQDKVPPHGASSGRLMGTISKSCGINMEV